MIARVPHRVSQGRGGFGPPPFPRRPRFFDLGRRRAREAPSPSVPSGNSRLLATRVGKVLSLGGASGDPGLLSSPGGRPIASPRRSASSGCRKSLEGRPVLSGRPLGDDLEAVEDKSCLGEGFLDVSLFFREQVANAGVMGRKLHSDEPGVGIDMDANAHGAQVGGLHLKSHLSSPLPRQSADPGGQTLGEGGGLEGLPLGGSSGDGPLQTNGGRSLRGRRALPRSMERRSIKALF